MRSLAPGLARIERRHADAPLPGILRCFAGGVPFALLVAIPQRLRFMLTFGDPRSGVKPRAAELLGFGSDLALWTGLVPLD